MTAMVFRTSILKTLAGFVLVLAALLHSSALFASDIRVGQASFTSSQSSVAVIWSTPFADTNYTAVCTAETVPSDYLLPVIELRSPSSMTVNPTDFGGAAGTLDCIAIPDSDTSDIQHVRVPYSGGPSAITVTWTVPFPDTSYTVACTEETQENTSGGFTGVVSSVTPASVSVTNGFFDTGTMHCIGVPDSDTTSGVGHSRVSAGGDTVVVPWTPVFPDSNYTAACSDIVLGATGSDSAIAIESGSKLPGSMTVIPEISSGSVDCIAVDESLGSLLPVRITGTVLTPVTKDSNGDFQAIVTISNRGKTSVSSVQVTVAGTTLGSVPLASAPAAVPSLAQRQSATITLTFPDTGSLTTATSAPLRINGTYLEDGVSVGFSLAFRVTLD